MLLLALLSGCYHMRVLAEPIQPETVHIALRPEATLQRIKRLLDSEHHLRALEDENQVGVLITPLWHFATDTGLGQPAGGRQYFVQLRIAVTALDGKSVVTVTPYHYEIHTSYAYGLDGQVKTLFKIYPYEEYPGMFDLEPLKKELSLLAELIKRRCHE